MTQVAADPAALWRGRVAVSPLFLLYEPTPGGWRGVGPAAGLRSRRLRARMVR